MGPARTPNCTIYHDPADPPTKSRTSQKYNLSSKKQVQTPDDQFLQRNIPMLPKSPLRKFTKPQRYDKCVNSLCMSAKILVVEDNPDSRELVVTVLAHAGYEVIEAANGPESLREAIRHRPDLILMDLGLPGVQGDEVMSRIKSDPRIANIPIVVITAFDRNAGAVKRAMDAGANEIVFKPIDLKKLQDVARIFTNRAPKSQTQSPTHST